MTVLLMKMRRLGRTNLLVSEISLGTVEIGMDYGMVRRPEEPQAARLLHRALDLGINFIDAARSYGESEAIIGRALSSRRREFFLCSKAAAKAEQVQQSAEDSLRALRTDVIDVMMLHCGPDETPREDAAAALDGLKRNGCIRYTGASVYGERAALASIESGAFDVVQVAYSPLDRRPESRVFPAAERHDVGVIARSVLLRGVLTHRYASLPASLEPLRAAVERLAAAARTEPPALPELAYRYVLSSVPPHSALVGTAELDEVEAAVRYAGAGHLPPDTVARIRAVSVDNEALLNPATWTDSPNPPRAAPEHR